MRRLAAFLLFLAAPAFSQTQHDRVNTRGIVNSGRLENQGDALFKSGVPWYDVKAFGASGSAQSTTGSMASGSAALTLALAKDFTNGQSIAVFNAGANPTIAVPTGLAVTATAFANSIADRPDGAVRTTNVVTIATVGQHRFLVGDSIVIAGVTDTGFNGTFTVTTVPDATHFTYAQVAANATSGGGTATSTLGAATYNYRVAAIDVNGGITAPATAVFVTNSFATLSASKYNNLTWTAVTGASMYVVYGRTGSLTALGIARHPALGNPSFQDYGNALPVPGYVPNILTGTAIGQILTTTISSGGGTTSLVLAASASNTVSSVTVQHDDTAAINSAVSTAATAGGGTVFFPASATYNFGTLTLPATTAAGWVVLKVNGTLSPLLPITITNGLYMLSGGNQAGVKPAFIYEQGSAILPNGLNPVIKISGVDANLTTIENLVINGFPGDAILTTGGAVHLTFRNLAFQAHDNGIGSNIRMGTHATADPGGFNFYITRCAFNGALTTTQPDLYGTAAGQVYVSYSTFNRRGAKFDANGANAIGTNAFDHVLTENFLDGAFLTIDATGTTSTVWSLAHIELADPLSFPNYLIHNPASTQVGDVTIIESRGWQTNIVNGNVNYNMLGAIGTVGPAMNNFIHLGGSAMRTGRQNTAGFNIAPQTNIPVAVQAFQDGNQAMIVRRNSATSSANIQEWQDEAGAVLAGVSQTGAIRAPTIGPSAAQQHTLPALPSSPIVISAGAQTLIDKTLTSPTLTTPIINGPISGTGIEIAVGNSAGPIFLDLIQSEGSSGVPIFFLPSAHTFIRLGVWVTTAGSGCTSAGVLAIRDLTTSTNVTTFTIALNPPIGVQDSGAISFASVAGRTYAITIPTAAAGCVSSPVGRLWAVYR